MFRKERLEKEVEQMSDVIDDENVLAWWYDSRTEFVVSFDVEKVDVDLSRIDEGEVIFFIKGTRKEIDVDKFEKELKDILKGRKVVYVDELEDIIEELGRRKVRGSMLLLLDCLKNKMGIEIKGREGDCDEG